MKKLLLITFVIATIGLSAQDVNLSGSQLNLNALPLTLSYEGKIGAKQSLTLAGGLGYGYFFSSSSDGESYGAFVAIPVFMALSEITIPDGL